MKLLLDTHILLWAADGTLPISASGYILDESNDLFFSPASLWEVIIKRSLGRDDFDVNPHSLYNGLLDNGYTELPITAEHTLLIDSMLPIHKDPFDRILLAQAASCGMSLLTADSIAAEYPGSIILLRH